MIDVVARLLSMNVAAFHATNGDGHGVAWAHAMRTPYGDVVVRVAAPSGDAVRRLIVTEFPGGLVYDYALFATPLTAAVKARRRFLSIVKKHE